MKIIVGASRPNHFKIGAWLIMWWEETPASHVYLYIPRASGIHLLYQAIGSGVEFMGYHQFLHKNRPVFEKEIEIPGGTKQKLLDYLIPKLGTRYSVPHLIGLFYKRLMRYLFGKIVKNPYADGGKRAVCVEALVGFLQSENISLEAGDPEDMGMYEAMALLKTIPGNELLKT